MSEFKLKNNTINSYNFNQINNLEKRPSITIFQKIAYYFLIFVLIFRKN